ncbi:MAG: hypothetical protein AAGK09_05820 [Planctomycetota bacterium]
MRLVLRRLMSGIGLWTILSGYLIYVIFAAIFGSMLAGLDDVEAAIAWFDGVAFTVLSVMLGLLCAWRVMAFHPMFLSNYEGWLAQTPWSTRLPLPLGPVGPTLWDMAAVLAVSAFLWGVHGYDARITLLICLLGFAVPLMLTSGPVLLISMVGLPLLWYPHGNLVATLLVVTAWLPVLVWGMRRELAKFPFGNDEWNREPVEELRSRANKSVGWPFDRVGPRYEQLSADKPPADRFQRRRMLWGVVLVLAWYAHTLAWPLGLNFDLWVLMGRNDEPIFLVMIVLFAVPLIVAFGRFLCYMGNTRPPLSLVGRLATGRLILPRYDVAWVAPLTTLISASLVVLIIFVFRVPLVWGLPLWVLATMIPAVSIGPSLEAWRYTGNYGYFRPLLTVDDKSSKKSAQSIGDIKIKLG